MYCLLTANMPRNECVLGLKAKALLVATSKMPVVAQGLLMDSHGRVVMGENVDRLPEGCRKLMGDGQLVIGVGRKFADTSKVYGYSKSTWLVPPCTRLSVTLVNSDQVRHQWVVRGLPEKFYPGGVFALEAPGGEEVTGTFIVPASDRAYLVRSEVNQQFAQGLSGQLIVGKGSLPTSSQPSALFSGMLVLGFVAAVLGAPYLFNWLGKRFFGMRGRELSGYLFNRLIHLAGLGVRALALVLRLFKGMKPA